MSLLPSIEFDPVVKEQVIEEDDVVDVEPQSPKQPKEDIVPEVEEKPKLDTSEIFINKNRPKSPARSTKEEEIIIQQQDNPKLTKSGRKKRVMSEKQKEHLKKARAIALEKRKAQSILKKQEKELKAQERAEKKRIKDEEKAEKERIHNERMKLIEEREEQLIKRKENLITPPPVFDRKMIEDIMYQGIKRYDTERKARKLEKKKLQQEQLQQQQHNQQVMNTIQRARGTPSFHQPSPYAHCFNFS